MFGGLELSSWAVAVGFTTLVVSWCMLLHSCVSMRCISEMEPVIDASIVNCLIIILVTQKKIYVAENDFDELFFATSECAEKMTLQN